MGVPKLRELQRSEASCVYPLHDRYGFDLCGFANFPAGHFGQRLASHTLEERPRLEISRRGRYFYTTSG